MLPPDERRSLNILGDNRVETGLLWKTDVPHLSANHKIAINRSELLERNFQKPPDFAKHYHHQIEGYTALDHARQLSKEEAKSNHEITNYIPHHEVLNKNKPGKVCVVFGASAKSHNISLNDNLLPGVDFLNNLVSVLLQWKKCNLQVWQSRRCSIRSECV